MKPTIRIDGREYRKFIPYPEEITDNTLRCIFCGQIDEEPWHDPILCAACEDFNEDALLAALGEQS